VGPEKINQERKFTLPVLFRGEASEGQGEVFAEFKSA
jgi:hypothetical protein